VCVCVCVCVCVHVSVCMCACDTDWLNSTKLDSPEGIFTCSNHNAIIISNAEEGFNFVLPGIWRNQLDGVQPISCTTGISSSGFALISNAELG